MIGQRTNAELVVEMAKRLNCVSMVKQLLKAESSPCQEATMNHSDEGSRAEVVAMPVEASAGDTPGFIAFYKAKKERIQAKHGSCPPEELKAHAKERWTALSDEKRQAWEDFVSSSA